MDEDETSEQKATQSTNRFLVVRLFSQLIVLWFSGFIGFAPSELEFFYFSGYFFCGDVCVSVELITSLAFTITPSKSLEIFLYFEKPLMYSSRQNGQCKKRTQTSPQQTSLKRNSNSDSVKAAENFS